MPHRNWAPKTIPGNPKVSLAVAAYNRHDPLLTLLYSLKSQSYTNWEAVIMHDGPCDRTLCGAIAGLNDGRIRLCETDTRAGQYGHPHRKRAADLCTGDYIGMTNDDNYYVPVYFEAMLHALTSTDAAFAHCDMIHDYWDWAYFSTKPRRARIDLGCFLAKADLVKGTPWRNFTEEGDGIFIEELAAKGKVVHLPMCLFCHN